jgi:hypothetical protein
LAAVIAILLLLGISPAIPCSFSTNYFYEVTNLRGTVVRQQARLILYEYCWPCDVFSRGPVKSVVANGDGKFDFGSLKPGHYYLRIEDEKGPLSAWFQVEVKGPQNANESETIDISPVYPDCTGGHEFIVKRN